MEAGGCQCTLAGSPHRLEQLLARADSPGTALRTIYDAYNDEEVVLSKEEIRLIQRIRSGRFPHVEARHHALQRLSCP